MSNKLETHILKLSCKDQVGIVAKISSILAESNCNIVESKQFTDQQNGNFFIRQTFTLYDLNTLSKLFRKSTFFFEDFFCVLFLRCIIYGIYY